MVKVPTHTAVVFKIPQNYCCFTAENYSRIQDENYAWDAGLINYSEHGLFTGVWSSVLGEIH